MSISRINGPESAKSESNGKADFDSFTSQIRNINITNTSPESLRESLRQIFNCEAVILYTYDHSEKILLTQGIQLPDKVHFHVNLSADNLVGYVAATGKPLNIFDVHSREELGKYHKNLKFDDSLDAILNINSRSTMLIPLPYKNKLVGIMEIINKTDGKPFPETDFIRAKAISLVIGLALVKIVERKKNNAPSSDNTKDVENDLNVLSQTISNAKNPVELFSGLHQSLEDIFGAAKAIIFGVDRDKNEFFSESDWNESTQKIRLPIDPSSITGFAAAQRQLLNIKDVNDPQELSKYSPDLQLKDSFDKILDTETQSLLTVPLTHSDQLMGILQLVNKNNSTDGFSGLDDENALKISSSLAQAFENLNISIEPKPTKFSFLIDHGYLTDDELTIIVDKSEKTGSDIEELLIKELYLRSIDVGKSLENFHNVPYTGYDESIVLPNLKDLHIDYKYQFWVPLQADDSGVVVLVNDPSDQDTIKEINEIFPHTNIDIKVGLKMDIKKYISNYDEAEEVSESVETQVLPGDDKVELTIAEEYQNTDTEEQNATADSTGKFFDEIITIAIKQGVTDIHIEPGMDGKNLLVRLRKEGACRVFEEIPANFQKEILSHIKELAHLDASVDKLPQNGKFVWSLGPNRYELSVVIFPTIGDLEDAMIRVSSLGKTIPGFMSMTDMEFSDPNLDKIMSRIHTAKGMILITGPEGTGKTTSLHALLNHLNTSDKKIVTAENPVDIVQNGLRQLQMNEENGLDYALALETFLLGNPDIIMVGEIDKDTTLKLCAQAAQQRLIFTSLKAKSTMDAIRKMREMNIDPTQFADAIVLIMAQKLVPSLCDNCKEDYHPSQEEFVMLEKFYGDKNFSELGFQYNDNLTLKKAVGCKQCIFTGYSGQIALHEVLERTPELNRLIAENAPMEEIHNQALKDGMITLNQDGIYKIMNGDCDFKKIQEAFLPGRF
jgi:type II secretory ATPase GspE/PulE/Tfp pilus assembly ATPase PilB-like protein/GAF domain-containing protein